MKKDIIRRTEARENILERAVIISHCYIGTSVRRKLYVVMDG
jgi:hypothetical protein